MLRKQASLASLERPPRHLAVVWLCCVALCLCSFYSYPQTTKLDEIPHVGQVLLEVSEATLEKPVTTESGAVLRVERLGGLVRFTATHDGLVTRSQWYQAAQGRPPVVFGTADRKFHELENRILVKLIDPEGLDAIKQELNAVRAKRYRGLGYSVLWLRRNQDPIEVFKRLQSDQRIEHAELQLKRPIMIPL